MRSFAAGLTAAQLEQMLAPYIADRQTEAARDNPSAGTGATLFQENRGECLNVVSQLNPADFFRGAEIDDFGAA